MPATYKWQTAQIGSRPAECQAHIACCPSKTSQQPELFGRLSDASLGLQPHQLVDKLCWAVTQSLAIAKLSKCRSTSCCSQRSAITFSSAATQHSQPSLLLTHLFTSTMQSSFFAQPFASSSLCGSAECSFISRCMTSEHSSLSP